MFLMHTEGYTHSNISIMLVSSTYIWTVVILLCLEPATAAAGEEEGDNEGIYNENVYTLDPVHLFCGQKGSECLRCVVCCHLRV